MYLYRARLKNLMRWLDKFGDFECSGKYHEKIKMFCLTSAPKLKFRGVAQLLIYISETIISSTIPSIPPSLAIYAHIIFPKKVLKQFFAFEQRPPHQHSPILNRKRLPHTINSKCIQVCDFNPFLLFNHLFNAVFIPGFDCMSVF